MTAEPSSPPLDDDGLRPPLTNRWYLDILAEQGLDDPDENERSWQIFESGNERHAARGRPAAGPSVSRRT